LNLQSAFSEYLQTGASGRAISHCPPASIALLSVRTADFQNKMVFFKFYYPLADEVSMRGNGHREPMAENEVSLAWSIDAYLLKTNCLGAKLQASNESR
jgi:hypothetical protein